jgi:hypothetical protein
MPALSSDGSEPPQPPALEWARRHRLSDDAGLPLEPTLLQVRRASLLASGV